MKDGLYDLTFKALGRTHDGRLAIKGNVVDGGDPVHRVRGHVTRSGNNIVASFEVAWRSPSGDGEGGSPAGHPIRMSGTGSHTDFKVIGLAPLGLIVELEGRWKESSG